MTTNATPLAPRDEPADRDAVVTLRPTIDVTDDTVTIRNLTIEDPAVVSYLAAIAPARREDEVRRLLGVGARGVTSMGVGVSLAEVEEQVAEAISRTIGAAVDRHAHEAMTRIGDALVRGGDAVERKLDPAVEGSHTAAALSRLEHMRHALESELDPEGTGVASRALQAISRLVGADGEVEARIRELLDPFAADSPLSRLRRDIESQIREVRDVVTAQSARQEEAERGTAKGVEYEDVVEGHLRAIAGRIGGCIVERTGTEHGGLAGNRLAGDFLLTLPCSTRIVIEAKRRSKIPLNGSTGILDELDKAMANRNAAIAICISAEDAYPAEVGSFARYGNRILVVDDGEGMHLDVAVRLAVTMAQLERTSSTAQVDFDRIEATIERLSRLVKRIGGSKKRLTSITDAVEEAKKDLDAYRTELKTQIADLEQAIRTPS